MVAVIVVVVVVVVIVVVARHSETADDVTKSAGPGNVSRSQPSSGGAKTIQ